MDYYLKHDTILQNLEGILKEGALLPPNKTKVEKNYGIDFSYYTSKKEYEKNIFTTLLIPVNKIDKTYPKDEYIWRMKDSNISLIFNYESLIEKQIKKSKKNYSIFL